MISSGGNHKVMDGGVTFTKLPDFRLKLAINDEHMTNFKEKIRKKSVIMDKGIIHTWNLYCGLPETAAGKWARGSCRRSAAGIHRKPYRYAV